MDPALGEEGIAAMIEKFKALVETQGTVTEIDEWGKRRLAYPINDLNEGHYVLMTFTAAPELPAELDRVLKITEGVMRSMIICKDE
jgi:small subunit ribosomal protein S6